MSNENLSLERKMSQSMSVKSLKDLVRARDTNNVVLLVDVSYSMAATMRNGKARIAGLREVVKGMQEKKPSIKMIAFGLGGMPVSHDSTGLEAAFGIKPAEGVGVQVAFVETIPDPQGGTPLAEGIDFARENGVGRAVVISDGGPNDPSGALEAARRFGGRIDVVYVGDPGDAGSSFLERLAEITGGIRYEGDLSNVKELTGAVVGLLTGAAPDAPSAINLGGDPTVFEEDVDDEDDEEDDDDEDEDDEDEEDDFEDDDA